MAQTIGIIGAGMIGGQVARLSVAAGLNVVISNSRAPETLESLVEELGARSRAATPVEAARGDLVVLAVPFFAFSKLPAEALAGTMAIDTMNYYPERGGHMSEVQTDKLASSELVQRQLPRARLVKALNNVDWVRLLSRARRAGDADRSALPIASDDGEANAAMAHFLNLVGYDTVDMGSLADSWRSEPTTPAYVMPYIAPPPEGLTAETARQWFLTAPGEPVPIANLRALLDKAVRHDRMVGSVAGLPGASV